MTKTSLNGGYLSNYITGYPEASIFNRDAYLPYSGIENWKLFGSAVVEEGNEITLPANDEPDTAAIWFIFDNMDSSAAHTQDDVNTINGRIPFFQLIRSDSAADNNITVNSYYTTFLGTSSIFKSPDTTTSNHFIIALGFRSTGLFGIDDEDSLGEQISRVQITEVNGQATTSNPGSQTLLNSEEYPTYLSFIYFAQRGSNTNNMSLNDTPVSDGLVASIKSGLIKQRVYYTIGDTYDINAPMTGDLNDAGAQGIQSFTVQILSKRHRFSSKYDYEPKKRNSGIWNFNSLRKAELKRTDVTQGDTFFNIGPTPYVSSGLQFAIDVESFAPWLGQPKSDALELIYGNKITLPSNVVNVKGAINCQAIQNGAPAVTGGEYLSDFIGNGNSFTVSIWIKSGVEQTFSSTGILHKPGTTGGGFPGSFLFVVDSGSFIRFSIRDIDNTTSQSVSVGAISSADMLSGDWVQYTGVVKYTSETDITMSIYRNGKLADQISFTNFVIDNDATKALIIGNRGNDRPFDGNIGQILFYREALSASEIYMNYIRTKDRFSV